MTKPTTEPIESKLVSYIRAGYPGLYIISAEEHRICKLFQDITRSDAVLGEKGFQLYTWSITDGITNVSTGGSVGTDDILDMLDKFMQLPEKSILLAHDFHMFLDAPDPVLTRKIKSALLTGKNSNRVFCIVGCRFQMQPELEKEFTPVEFSLPSRDDFKPVLQGIAKSAGITINGNTDQILDASLGLTTVEAENSYARSIVKNGDILPEVVYEDKCLTVKKHGILEIVGKEHLATPDQVGGIDLLMGWMTKRKASFGKEAREYGLPMPKGVLIPGVPGCGKSLACKCTASIFNRPLVKMDAGKIFGSLVGQSEENLRTAISTAEAIAPCVLWVDEIEKAFAGSKSSGQTDGGTTSRVFGNFLQWMQDKSKPVFVVATANDISQLPPEFLRKGRFDEIFFVDLPNATERREIWRIHIAAKNRNPDDFDLDALVEATKEWTGAEIEALFTEALFTAFSDDKREPTTDLLLQLSQVTVCMSRMMGDKIDALRHWASTRARPASTSDKATQLPTTRKLM